MIPHFLKINSEKEAIEELIKLNVDPGGIELMAPKMLGTCIKLNSVSLKSAHIIKQEMLALGGDCALPRSAMEFKENTMDIIIIGTLKQYRLLSKKLKSQPFGLKEIGDKLLEVVENYYKEPKVIKTDKVTLDFSKGPLIMGILNVTPDSFYDGGKYYEKDLAIKRGLELVDEGADIIDIGGESTRPGSQQIQEDEELRRVIPVIEELSKRISVPISIDTYKSGVARRAIEAGAVIVNDISGLQFDEKMVEVVAEKRVPVVIMHIKGTPANMQINPHYDDVIHELLGYFGERINFALSNGVPEDNIIIDPGIGFGKRLEDNLSIIKNLSSFRIFNKPILIGVSRKSFIGKILELPPEDRLEGTITAVLYSIINGAKIVRVHDVKEIKRCIKVYNGISSILEKEKPVVL